MPSEKRNCSLSEGEPKSRSLLHFPDFNSLDPGHNYLTKEWAFQKKTIERFEAGYCRVGMMRDRVVLPIHNRDGELLAYAGRSTKQDPAPEELYTYPDNFNRSLELYNLHRAVLSDYYNEYGLILVADFFEVFRLYEVGFGNVIALMDGEMSKEQAELLRHLPSPSRKLTLFLPSRESLLSQTRILIGLSDHLYVRTIRSYCGAQPRVSMQGSIAAFFQKFFL